MSLQITRTRSMISKKFIGVFFAVLALLVQPIVSSNIPAALAATISDRIVINEVMANPLPGEKEWVELYNPTSSNVPLAGWALTYNNGSATYPIPVSEIIAGGIVVVEAPDANSYLNDSTDTVRLINLSSQEVDSVVYSNDAQNKSYARSYDGSTVFVAQANVTKGTTNGHAPTIIATPQFVAPTNNSAHSNGNFQVAWTNIANAAKYNTLSSTSNSLDSNGALNNAAFGMSWTTNSQSNLDFPEGTFYFQVQAEAADGTKSGWSDLLRVTIDKTAPAITNIQQVYESQQNGRINVTLTFNEATTQASLGQGWYEVSGSSKTKYSKIFYSTRSVTINPADPLGNTAPYTFIVDKTSPSISNIHYKDSGTSYVKDGKGIVLYFTANEPLTQFPIVTIGGQAASVNYENQANNVYRAYVFTNNSIPEGLLSLSIAYKDITGNVGTVATGTTDGSKIVVDRTAPTMTIQNSSIGSGSEKVFSKIGFNLYDANKIDKVSVNGVVKELSNAVYSNINNGQFGAVEGDNTVIAYDVAGNTSTYTFRLDTTKPTGSFSYSPSNDVIKKGPVTVTLTTSEPVATPEGWTKVSEVTFTKEFTNNVKDSFTVIDQAGNSSEKLSFEVKRIDNTSPVIDGVKNGDRRNSALTNFTVTDQNFKEATINGQKVSCTHSGANFIWNCIGPSDDGSYTLNAVDKAGNSTEIAFVIDTLLNQPTAITSNDGQLTNQPVLVTITADEPITIADNSWSKVSDNEWRRTYEQNTNGPVSVEVSDLAGNSKPVQYTVSGIDTVDPIITIGQINRTSDGRYIINGTVNETGVSVFVVINDGVAQAATVNGQTWNFTTAILPDGNYQITATGRDAAGNTSPVEQRSFTAVAPFTGGSTVSTISTPLQTLAIAPSPLRTPQTSAGSSDGIATTVPTSTNSDMDTDGQVLGTKNQKKSDVVAAVTPSDQGWKLWGVAWYWWLIPLLLTVAIWRYLVYRRNSAAE